MTFEARDLASEDLDVMAEAYHRALEQLPGDSTEPEITLNLIAGLTAAIRDGIRDEDALARAALAQVDIEPQPA
jgi:hypothetical protein